ncbi:serine threonine protein kinase [Pochonia chlamydosporia 170]|uniref:Serine threonine protein kinase n=1 Tax=Pochonia chlamydosporia 170 TaxID=1380566 RepID=A0A179F1F9_METCM|nr:serine threonine protein kinase [Pochonia chlamydosporia 170]OAQ58949.1 serine threonine protein kinase [Pochonia chlamydosporia 170]
MDDIEELRRRLREAESRAKEAEDRRDKAEALVTASQPQNLQQYLETCHSLHLAIEVVTDRSLTTQGETTNPTGRIFPRRIIPWDSFAMRQQEIWNDLSISDLFSKPAFPSNHQMEYVKSLLKPISSELGLRDFERDVVENAVQKLVDRAHTDPLLRSTLGIQGTVTFESHTNLGTTEDLISEPMEHMSLGGDNPVATAQGFAPKQAAAPKARRRARGKGNRADQFCIYRSSEGQNVPAIAIEYKAPHKLSLDEIITGLEAGIQPERDVINKDSQGFALTARRLAAAVVTQLFSYMIGKGIQFGYICTGQALVFLHIPDDPSIVYFSVCVPNQDVMDDDETRLHRTAVAQVFAFILQALRARPPPETWHDEAETLGTWAVEYDDILRDIPMSERKRKEPRASPYKPQRWKGFKRSPIRTRYRCQQPGSNAGRLEDNDEDPPSPTPNPSRTRGKASPSVGTSSGSGNQGQRSGQQKESSPVQKPNIQSRLFCTHRCLLGLAHGGSMDKNCPNASHHGQMHISRLEFLRLIRHQLAIDRGRDANCAPLHRSGSRGSLFKVRLASHGYTLVAKGVEGLDLACLQHENDMYSRLQAIQGKYVPVCLGTIGLVRPYYYDSGVYVHFMFLSWAGLPLFDCVEPAMKDGIANAVTMAFKAMHKLRVLHRDAEPRNILYNTTSRELMVVDFERAEFHGRRPLGSIGPNQSRKRKRGVLQNQKKDDFARELESATARASSCVANLPSPSEITSRL